MTLDTRADDDDRTEAVPTRMEGYRLLAPLRSGADGTAYVAVDEQTGERVEVHRLFAARTDGARWRQIEERLARLDRVRHPGLRRERAQDLHTDDPWRAVDLWRGNLAVGLCAGPVTPDEAESVLGTLAGALHLASRVGLHHGCVCPSHVDVTDDGAPMLDLSGVDVGEPFEPSAADLACLAPERARGEEPSQAADVFGLGALVYHMLMGKPWVPGGGVVLPRLADLVAAMLSPEPEQRPTLREVRAALGDEDSGPPTGPFSTSASRTSWRLAEEAELLDGVGRFRFEGLIARGGMGAVYEAVDETTGERVAVKLMNARYASDPVGLRRFLREGHVLAQLRSPFIARYVEAGEASGRPFLVMELVDGTPLHRALAQRGRLEERDALDIAAAVAHGLADVHDLGLVHRDVKPANVILLEGDDRPLRAKLCDFGIARRADREGTVVTDSGVVVGTPTYMAPEQCAGRVVDARADVYSLGAVLFSLLAGRPPFEADNAGALIHMHLTSPVPDLSRLAPEVSERAVAIVERALEKEPERRFANAREMLAELVRLRRGEVRAIEHHPRLPDAAGEEITTYLVELDLSASPPELWPHVSNTERLNRAIGLGAVTWEHDASGGQVTTLGRMRASGLALEWQEHPYEWVAPTRMGVLREMRQGPFRWYRSTVSLDARGGGTRLLHRLDVCPRGLLGRTAAAIEMGLKARRNLRRVYERIDGVLAERRDATRVIRLERGDEFEPPHRLSSRRARRLDASLDRLIAAGVSPAIVTGLGQVLRTAPPQEVARIRPAALARQLDQDRGEVIRALLLAADAGALVLGWDVLCPTCRVPTDLKATLRDLRDHERCDVCAIDFAADFGRSVELVFRVHPSIREADDGVYCVGGPGHRPHVLSQVRLAPGEPLEMDLYLDAGTYRLTGPQLPHAWMLAVRPGARLSHWDLPLGARASASLTRALSPGRQRVRITNDFAHELLVRLERADDDRDRVTAAEAACVSTFRELFPQERIAAGQLVGVSRMTMLVAAVPELERLHAGSPDREAFGRVLELCQRVQSAAEAHAGCLVKVHGRSVLAAFHDPEAAVRTAMALDDGEARVVVHEGPCMVATINDRIDYFGATVHDAEQLLRSTLGAGVVVSEHAAADPGVAACLVGSALMAEVHDGALVGHRVCGGDTHVGIAPPWDG